MDSSTRIVGFHATCHVEHQRPNGSWSFEVLEFARLVSGDLMLLRVNGWSSSGRTIPNAQDALITMKQVLLPDEHSGHNGDHPWDEIKAYAAERGLVHQDDIESLPFTYAIDEAFTNQQR